MSDFVQTMKDWRRMCMAMEKLSPDDACCGCPLEGYGCPAIYEEDSNHVDYADVEKNVTAWAAKHPEPVYPTWAEWLKTFGVVEVTKNKDKSITVMMKPELLNPIPDDIAQKLGLEPKEGT